MSSGGPGGLQRLAMSFMGSRVLQAAVELRLFTALGQGPMSGEALREKLGLNPRGALHFFDALVSLGLLERTEEGYANGPDAARFLDRNLPSYLGGAVESTGLMYQQWAHLVTALRTGEQQPAWTDRWSDCYSDPEYLRVMREAMTSQSMGWAQLLADKFPWERFRTFADLGTSEGELPATLVATHPHLSGVGLDLPALRPHFERHAAKRGVADRLRFQGGNFFEDPFPEAHVIIMSGVLHSWGPEEQRMLVDKAFEALPPGGVLVVRDGFVAEGQQPPQALLLLSLQMQIDSNGGRAYTQREIRGRLEDAGFIKTYVEELTDSVNVIVVGTKPGILSSEMVGTDEEPQA